jgi:hypothetical protein
MGSHCMIGAMFDEDVADDEDAGLIVASYCHYDGYIDGVGRKLIQFFNGDKAFAVADFGYISSLEAESLEELYSEQQHPDNSIPSEYYESINDFLDGAKDNLCEYAYLYMNKTWYYSSIAGQHASDLRKLKC